MEDNKLIAEFMGGQRVLPDEDVYNMPTHNNLCYGVNELQYDTSWDWLIPVVNKIEMECEGVPLQLIDVSFYDEIHEVYQAVIEFIKIHNDEQ